jgi:hypothetical protein
LTLLSQVDRDRLARIVLERVEAVAGASEAALDRLAEAMAKALGELQRRRHRRHPGDRQQRRAQRGCGRRGLAGRRR